MHTIFFLFTLLATLTATITEPGETSIPGDEITETQDFTEQVTTITTEEKTVGGETVELTKEVQFVASPNNDVITLENPSISNIVVEIPDQTSVQGPSNWDNKIVPPTSSTGGGQVPGNFLTPSSSILVGSPDVILVFDSPVTLILNGITGQIAYRNPGSSNWILISGCTGTFANPVNPTEPGECSISDGTNTKVLTYHFTQFAGLSTPTPAAASTPSTSSSGSSGGHGRTGVGPSSGGGYAGPGLVYDIPEKPIIPGLPKWFNAVIIWQQQGLISTEEMLQAWKWLKSQ